MDLEGRITVKSHKGHEFAQANNLEFFEISAVSWVVCVDEGVCTTC